MTSNNDALQLFAFIEKTFFHAKTIFVQMGASQKIKDFEAHIDYCTANKKDTFLNPGYTNPFILVTKAFFRLNQIGSLHDLEIEIWRMLRLYSRYIKELGTFCSSMMTKVRFWERNCDVLAEKKGTEVNQGCWKMKREERKFIGKQKCRKVVENSSQIIQNLNIVRFWIFR